MKFRFFLLLWIGMPAWLYSQPKDSTYTFAHYDKDSSLSQVEEKFNNTLISCTYKNKTTGKIVAKFNRFDDSSYFFRSFDKEEMIVNECIVSIRYIQISEAINIPDIINDADGTKGMLKDTMIESMTLEYYKNGDWDEMGLGDKLWSGKYRNGLKMGLWLRKVNEDYSPALSTIDSIILYDKDTTIRHHYATSYLTKMIAGKWDIDTYATSQYYTFFTRRANNFLASVEFLDTHKYKFYAPHQHFYQEEKKQHSWDIINGNLFINGKPFDIILLTKDELIIKGLPDL